jgi:4-diphosphocytidyl-2-C-methyl-D-erythritol kinase
MNTAVRVRCRAKLNLGLEVLGRRKDGYHDLLTVFHSISLCDALEVRLGGEGTQVVCSQPDVPTGGANLCSRAVEALRTREGLGAGVRVALEKRIPVGGGLGGGSADAAGTLVALQRLTGLGDAAALSEIARELGADVPFFLTGGTRLARGVGHDMSAVEVPCRLWFVICRPDLTVSTAEAYRALTPSDFSDGRATEGVARALSEGDLARAAQSIRNAFCAPLAAAHPVLRELASTLKRAGALAAVLTGSGACVFGLFADEGTARAAQLALPVSAAWSIVVCSAQPAVEVCDLLG